MSCMVFSSNCGRWRHKSDHINYAEFLFYFILWRRLWLLYIVIPYHAFILFLFADCFKLHVNTYFVFTFFVLIKAINFD